MKKVKFETYSSGATFPLLTPEESDAFMSFKRRLPPV
jgi:hypothetical protein